MATKTLDARSTAAAEAPLTLDEPAPRALGLLDQLGMWGNLGVSILGFTGAIYILYPTSGPALALGAALLALVLGTVLGTAAVAVVSLVGTETGQPTMVLLRGLFGARLSWLPTVLNVVQLLGWTTFELVTISTAMQQVTSGVPRWVYVTAGGVITTVLALRPLGWIRMLRRYVTVLVVIALGYLAVQLLRNPLPALGHGSVERFLDRRRHRCRCGRLVRTDGRRLLASLDNRSQGSRRDVRRLLGHPDCVLRHRPGRAAHCRAR